MTDFSTLMASKTATTRKGAYSELNACMWLLAQGYEVFRNIAPSGPADIIAFKDDNIIKIDVKTISQGKLAPAFQRQATRKAQAKNVEVLYVYWDGSCHWAKDVDPHIDHNFDRTCPVCQKQYTATRVKNVFCSDRCRGIDFRNKEKSANKIV